MADNDPKMKTFEKFLDENPEILETFKNIDPQTLKKITQASIVLKGGVEELDIRRLTPKQVEQYLLMHPVVPRGIEIKANRMTGRGYTILPRNQNPKAKEAAEKMRELLDNSGGEMLLNGWIKDGFAFGNGYLTLLPDKKSGEVVLLSREHPIFFRIARYKKDKSNSGVNNRFQNDNGTDWDTAYGAMKINEVTKKPSAYTQVVFTQDKSKVEPIGIELSADQVGHLVFDVWGDEAEGVGLIQYLQLILKYIMNIEEAGAEGIYRSGITQKVVTTNIKTEKDLKKLAKNLQDINASDAIVVPEGTDVKNLVPGVGEFTNVHTLLLNLIAIRLGVPKPILTLDGTDTNKATMRELMRDLIYDLHADELKVARTLEDQVFKYACHSIYGHDFEDIPKFRFNDFEEGKEEKAEILSTVSDYVRRMTESYKTMIELGNIEAAQRILDVLMTNLPVQDIVDEENEAGQIKAVPIKVPEPEPVAPPENPVKPDTSESSDGLNKPE